MKLIITLILIALPFGLINSQTQIINSENNKLDLSNLKEGESTYLVYFTDSLHNVKTTGDIWKRTTTLKTYNNQEVVEFNWKWYHKDSLRSDITNIVDKKTFAPKFHKAIHKEKWIIAYKFTKNEMIPIDSIRNNLALRNGRKKLEIPIISWEQDLETFPLLPIKNAGQNFNIAFFDPNEENASYHMYKVIGKEYLTLNADSKILCWLLKIEYDENSFGTFWLSHKSQEVIKSKEFFNGMYRYKVKLY